MLEAGKHKGTSVIEVLQNCVIFNDGIHNKIADRTWKAEKTIMLKHGEKMMFGLENDKGLVLDGWNLKAVTIGEDGYSMDDILVHDTTTLDNSMHVKLRLMGYDNDLPVALGVIRAVEAPTYDDACENMIEEVRGKNSHLNFTDFVMQSSHIWEIK